MHPTNVQCSTGLVIVTHIQIINSALKPAAKPIQNLFESYALTYVTPYVMRTSIKLSVIQYLTAVLTVPYDHLHWYNWLYVTFANTGGQCQKQNNVKVLCRQTTSTRNQSPPQIFVHCI